MKKLARSPGVAGANATELRAVTEAMLEVVRPYADAHVSSEGIAALPLEGVFILRETAPSSLQYAITKPLVALVLQGGKRVTMGSQNFDFGAGESLLITMDVPTVSQVTTASATAPYYSVVVELEGAVITELVGKMGGPVAASDLPVRVDRTEVDVAEAALRLLKLLDRPQALATLGPQAVRELYFWLLSGRHGSSMRALGVTDSHSRRIARAVEMLRARYAEPLRVETLAEAAGMSLSVFTRVSAPSPRLPRCNSRSSCACSKRGAVCWPRGPRSASLRTAWAMKASRSSRVNIRGCSACRQLVASAKRASGQCKAHQIKGGVAN